MTKSPSGAKGIGRPLFYHGGFISWMTDAGNTGTISFETPAKSVNLRWSWA